MMPRPIHNFAFALPFFIARDYLSHKEMMHQHMTSDFKVVFSASILNFVEPIVYPHVVYGQDWACTVFV